MKMAMKEARRHLRAENNDFDATLHRLQETCQYRMVSLVYMACLYVFGANVAAYLTLLIYDTQQKQQHNLGDKLNVKSYYPTDSW